MAENIFSKFFGLINRMIDPPIEEEDDIEPQAEKQPNTRQDAPSKKQGKLLQMQLLNSKGDLNVHLVKDIQYPKSAKEAVDRIKGNMIVVFNFEDTDQDISQKTIDFISGAAYALGGDVQRITEYVVLFLPTSGKFSQEQKKRLEDSGFASF